jgi:hypothetical protein
MAIKLQDRDLPARAFDNIALTRVLNGLLYQHIDFSFSDETNSNGQFLSLKHRRPSVRTGYCRTVVDDSVSLLFSEGHFPGIDASDKLTRDAIVEWVKEIALNETMIDAATKGSVGSVALQFRVARGRPSVRVLSTAFLTPEFDPDFPDELVKVVEQYKVYGSQIAGRVKDVQSRDRYWHRREWTSEAETWFTPWPVSDKEAVPAVDETLTVEHGLGFVPIIWIRNLPGGDEVDGSCTFEASIDDMIASDYSLSQARRALIYAGDPKLLIKSPDGKVDGLSGGASNAIIVATDGDAKLLEINGTAATASVDFEKRLRQIAMEAAHGNRADPDKISAAQSGRAMEMMNQGLIWLADRLRTPYGERGLLKLIRMLIAASSVVSTADGGLLIAGKRYSDLKPDGLKLTWPRWYALTALDRQQDAQAAQTLSDGGFLSRRTITRNLAADYDVEDVDAEIKAADADRKAADARASRLAETVKTTASESLQSE